jgi:hypothetical protein
VQGFDEGLLLLVFVLSLGSRDSACGKLTVLRRLSGGSENVTRYTFGAGSLTVTLPLSPIGTSKRVGVCFAMVFGVLFLLDEWDKLW